MSAEKVDAWMPLWIGAYLADTMHLSRDSHGGYLLLLFAYWRNKGPLLDNDEDLAGITKATPAEWRKLRARLERFFVIEGGTWAHKRADEELAKAGLHKAKAVAKAKAGAEARWGAKKPDAPSMPQALPDALPEHVPKQCPTPSPKTSPSSKSISKASPSHPPAGGLSARFVEFWEAWPKSERKQDKKACAAKWAKECLDKIADQIIADVRTKRGTTKWQEGYIEAPLVYLNNERWNDGVEPDGGRPGVEAPDTRGVATQELLAAQAAHGEAAAQRTPEERAATAAKLLAARQKVAGAARLVA